MSVENLQAIREYLVKLRREVAVGAVEEIDGEFRNNAKRSIQDLVSIQETIEKVDRAIADETEAAGPEPSVYETRGIREI
ncbi:hypothetical protein GR138_26805 [Shinella kummerowiae]|uniref:Uncharacterized protein n=1 Tax=Shinella kummerowiae TaxID=417745 RepID=A0A6N8SIC7_9HYPH|nr:hypothetical protein [Shinella kummerowiae]MXN48814.1 hypothetical protein [Shinella kummerowiae]